jgi:hypothetical protein
MFTYSKKQHKKNLRLIFEIKVTFNSASESGDSFCQHNSIRASLSKYRAITIAKLALHTL